MRIGILGAGNIGQTLKAMLASVEGVDKASLADNAGPSDLEGVGLIWVLLVGGTGNRRGVLPAP